MNLQFWLAFCGFFMINKNNSKPVKQLFFIITTVLFSSVLSTIKGQNLYSLNMTEGMFEKDRITLTQKFQMINAQFPGGQDKMYEFLNENLRYPEEAKEKGISGKVFVQFVISREGEVTDVIVVKGIGGGCDEEAVRVVKMMPRWIPAEQAGKRIASKYVLPCTFTLSL